MSIRPLIRQRIAALFADGQDVERAKVTEQFIAEHPDEIAEHIDDFVRKTVNAEIKALCNEHPESVGQLALFPGLPAAIVIADGLARPLNRCTWDDLMIGRTERVENIAHAEKSLDRYDDELDRLRPHLESRPGRTVADVRHLLAGAS